MTFQLSPEFKEAFNLMENSSRNIFVTGNAGTGKSTLLNYFRDHTKKGIAVVAPTGVAALNVEGQTIHSFFKFRPDITPETVYKASDSEIYRELETLVIDEISMVRADLFDAMDRFLRINRKSSMPFGGVQVICVGDLYQLPPVVKRDEEDLFSPESATPYSSPYFFSSQAAANLDLHVIELKTIYRQREVEFIGLLNAIRVNKAKKAHLEKLNTRVDLDYYPDDSDMVIYLTTTNRRAAEINSYKIGTIDNPVFEYEADITGDFDARQAPTDCVLTLKVGAQVMMLNNDKEGRWVNGSIGRITDVQSHGDGFEDLFVVEFEDGSVHEVMSYTWDVYKYELNKADKTIVPTIVGSFTQYPMKLAWAITIHKSQGKTFGKAVIDTDRGIFAHGQLYVALSRCKSFDGIILRKPVRSSDVITDSRIIDFFNRANGIEAESEKKFPSPVSPMDLMRGGFSRGLRTATS